MPTGYALWVDLKDREQQRIAQAWELVTRPAPGNSGKGPAVEYLNGLEIPLTGIDLSAETSGGQAYLDGVDLIRANLHMANLFRADLQEANLSDAKNLTQEQLDSACGNDEARLPDGLTIKPCPIE